jgi:hypothetical protein
VKHLVQGILFANPRHAFREGDIAYSAHRAFWVLPTWMVREGHLDADDLGMR